jgi:hypothetical protein
MERKYIAAAFVIGLPVIYILTNIIGCIYVDFKWDKSTVRSSVPLDVVYVCSPKDFEVLPYSINSVRKYLKQPINKVVLISSKSKDSKDLARRFGMQYIEENELLNLTGFIDWAKKHNLVNNYMVDKWTWHYQQFLKLVYYKIASSNYYFIIDADVVMNRPFVVVEDSGRQTFYVGENTGHDSAAVSIRYLIGDRQYIPDASFIADLMCFNKNMVKDLIEIIESKYNMEFYKAAVIVEQKSAARFSEYELYGVYANYRDGEKSLSNYLPMSKRVKKRSSLFWNQYNLRLKQYPYIVYHDWANN